MAAIAYMYYVIVSKVLGTVKVADAGRMEVLMAAVRRLIAYPIIFFVGYVFGTINRIQNASHPDNPSVALYCLASLTLNINGVANAVVYGCNDSLQKDLRSCCGGGEDEENLGHGPPPVAAATHAEDRVNHAEDGFTDIQLDESDKADIKAVAEMQQGQVESPTGGL